MNIDDELYKRLSYLGIIPDETRSYNVGKSDYSKRTIQPWSIWIDYNLNPWDADIIKRTLRTKEEPGLSWNDSRIMDYEKIIHICKECIRQIKSKFNADTINLEDFENSNDANTLDVENCENPTPEMILSRMFTVSGLEIYNRFLHEHEICGKDLVVSKKGDDFLIECPVCKQQIIMPPSTVVEELHVTDEIFKKYGIVMKEIK